MLHNFKMKQSTDEPFFIPKRQTPKWETNKPVLLISKETLIKVITGQLPIGLLPFEIISEKERVEISEKLFALPWKKYEDTGETEDVRVLGVPFVDSKSLHGHLTERPDYYDAFQTIVAPIKERLFRTLEGYGLNIAPLVDPVTLLTYPDMVARLIVVPKTCRKKITGHPCTVLHCDFFPRDAYLKDKDGNQIKADFRMPHSLIGKKLHQASFCIQLEDGGYKPDKLFVHREQYSPELEDNFNDPELPWLYDASKLHSADVVEYTPQLRQTYCFSTINFHDVRDGNQNSKRLNLSIFFIYDEETNTLYPYN